MSASPWERRLAIAIMALATILCIYFFIIGSTLWWGYIVIGISFAWAFCILHDWSLLEGMEIALVWTVLQILTFISYLQGYQIEIVEGGNLLDVYRLRYEIFCEEKNYFEKPKEKILVDLFDNFSTHIVMRHRGKMCGGLRIVYYNPFGYPLEEYVNLSHTEQYTSETVEIGRWIVKKEYRNSHNNNAFVTIIIMLKTFVYLILRRKERAIIVTSEGLKDYLEALFGVQFKYMDQDRLEQRHLEARAHVPYFKKWRVVEPMLLNIDINYLIKAPSNKIYKNLTQWIISFSSVVL